MKKKKQRLDAEWEGRVQVNWWNIGAFILAGAIALPGAFRRYQPLRIPMKALIVIALLILAAWYCLWVAVPAVFSGSLQITNGKRVIAGHTATGLPIPEPPNYYPAGWGMPKYETITPRSH
jgi:hypothetical protein